MHVQPTTEMEKDFMNNPEPQSQDNVSTQIDLQVSSTKVSYSLNCNRCGRVFHSEDAWKQECDSCWRPIETAPVNVSVLAFIPSAKHYGPGIYRALLVDMGTGKRWMVSELHMGRDCGPHQQPTHWMPLPPAPSVSSGVGSNSIPEPGDVVP